MLNKKLLANLACSLLIIALGSAVVQADELPKGANKEPHIEVYLIQRKLYLKNGDSVVKEYPVGVARSREFMTPPGSYIILTKDKSPGWSNPYNPKIKIPAGPNNPLGTRWIGFHKVANTAYGIHGTNEPNSVGKFVSHGCIRMRIPDSEDLYERVGIGTPVKVIYNRFEIKQIEDDIALTINEDPYNTLPLNLETIKKEIIAKYPNATVNEQALTNLIQAPVFGQARLVGYIGK